MNERELIRYWKKQRIPFEEEVSREDYEEFVTDHLSERC